VSENQELANSQSEFSQELQLSAGTNRLLNDLSKRRGKPRER